MYYVWLYNNIAGYSNFDDEYSNMHVLCLSDKKQDNWHLKGGSYDREIKLS